MNKLVIGLLVLVTLWIINVNTARICLEQEIDWVRNKKDGFKVISSPAVPFGPQYGQGLGAGPFFSLGPVNDIDPFALPGTPVQPANPPDPTDNSTWIPAALRQTDGVLSLIIKEFGSASLDIKRDMTRLKIVSTNFENMHQQMVARIAQYTSKFEIKPTLTSTSNIKSVAFSTFFILAEPHGFDHKFALEQEEKYRCEMRSEMINSDKCPTINGFSNALLSWNTLETSLITGSGATLEIQFTKILDCLEDLLKKATVGPGSSNKFSFKDVAKYRIYLRDTDDLTEGAFHILWSSFLANENLPKPARVLEKGLGLYDPNALIGIEIVAFKSANNEKLERANNPFVFSHPDESQVVYTSKRAWTSAVYGVTNKPGEPIVIDNNGTFYAEEIASLVQNPAILAALHALKPSEDVTGSILADWFVQARRTIDNLHKVLSMAGMDITDTMHHNFMIQSSLSFFGIHPAMAVYYNGTGAFYPIRGDEISAVFPAYLGDRTPQTGIVYGLEGFAVNVNDRHFRARHNGRLPGAFTATNCLGTDNPYCPVEDYVYLGAHDYLVEKPCDNLYNDH